MEKSRLYYLLDRFGSDNANEAEKQELFNYIQSQESSHDFAEVGYELMVNEKGTIHIPAAYDRILQEIVGIDGAAQVKVKPMLQPRTHLLRAFSKWGWAAAVLLFFCIGAFYWIDRSMIQKPSPSAETGKIQPGKEGAVLTLADGSEVVLDTVKNSVIALQGGATAKVVNGALLYEGEGNEVVYNIMSTPKGRQFHITLPDGTDVWLNSASSIRYPTAFKGDGRRVEIKGEAYFEVAKNAKNPFRIDVDNNAIVEVLGTSLNINAYGNENSIKTTLISGSVAISSPEVVASGTAKGDRKTQSRIILKPGQQAEMPVDQRLKHAINVVNGANIDQVVAWKNGIFDFQDVSLEEVMRQLERWYDIEVVVEKGVKNIQFGGRMSRSVTLDSFLVFLKEMNVHYKLNGKKLIILP